MLGLGASSVIDPNEQRRAELEQEIAQLQGQVSQQPGQAENPFSGAGGAIGGLLDKVVSKAQAQAQTQGTTRLGELQAELQGFGAVPQGTTLSAQEQQAQAFQQLQESPGQQFLRKRQEKAILRNASATGGLGGGNVLNALQENAFGLAQTDIQNQFGRLGQLAGQGQQATTSTAQFGAGTSANIANLGVAGSEARASGVLGQQQARAQGTQELFRGLGQIAGQFNTPDA